LARKLQPDRVLFLVTLALVVFGVVMVFSSSAVIAQERFGDPNYFFFKQLVAASIGVALMFVVMKVDYHSYRKPAVVFATLALVVGLMLAVFFGTGARNTYRWIQFAGFNFQPSEVAKLALILFLAYFLEARKSQVNDIKFTLAPIAVIVALLAGLIILQRDLGTAVTLVLTAAILLFVGGLNVRWIGASAVLTLPVAASVFYLLVYRVQYRWNRILTWIDPWKDPLGMGYQITQAWISIGTGAVSGLGFMEGKQKLFYLPDAHTDFIFAVVGEEIGLVGTGGVLLLFLAFLWRGLRASMRAPDLFGFYLAAGITTMICLQAFINMSVVLGIMPTKGIPLPFLSYGGSSSVVMLAAVGMLLNVSQQAALETREL